MDNGTLKFIQAQIGYFFKNPDLLQQAFVRRSYSKENGGEDNEVLEFIGDKALDFVVVKLLAEKYGSYAKEYDDYDPCEDCNEFVSDFREGKLTEIKKKLVCREMLSSRIRTLGFQYELVMGKSDIDQRVYEQDSVQEDLFEAIVGAVSLDSDWDLTALTSVVDLMLDPNFYLENGFDEQPNYVEALQEWYQKKYHSIPFYQFRNDTLYLYGNHKKYVCQLNLYPLETGFVAGGDTKSEARMAVAEQAYRYLEEQGLMFTWIDEVGEPDLNRAVNQLQELYQKGYIKEPQYEFRERYDEDGNPVWSCICSVNEEGLCGVGDFSSKKVAKREAAYKMLCLVLGWGDDYEA